MLDASGRSRSRVGVRRSAFLASALVVKPFLSYRQRGRASRRSPGTGFAAVPRCVAGAGGGGGCDAMQWLRRSFIAGFFVTVPLFISVAAFVWIFGVVDGLTDAVVRPAARPARFPGLGHR